MQATGKEVRDSRYVQLGKEVRDNHYDLHWIPALQLISTFIKKIF